MGLTIIGNYCNTNITVFQIVINPLSANPIKWSNTLRQFVGC